MPLIINLRLSIPKIEAWVSQKLGVKQAKLPDATAIGEAVIEFIKDHQTSLDGVQLTEPDWMMSTDSHVTMTIEGESQSLRKICQLLESEFSPSDEEGWGSN